MSRAQFALGARLRAADTGRPVPVAAYAPVAPPTDGIAVTVDSDGERVYVTATDGHALHAGTDRDGLEAIAALGATMDAPRRTLIVGTTRELATLTALARAYPTATASPVIGWWDERVDYPGTDAVHVVTDAARLRWTLGVHPDREREVATWAEWLRIDSTGPRLLLGLAHATASGHTLPGLLSGSVIDRASWDRYGKRIAAGRPWWSRDTRIDAALGLIGRSHATEWYESIRYDDPLVALAGAHDGTIVPGTVTARADATITLTADRPLSRLRVDTKVTGWHGEPTDAGAPDCLSGTVDAATITAAPGTGTAALTITVSGLPKRSQTLNVGDRVTLRPARVDPHMQANARSLTALGYRRGTNWIAGRGKPIPRRGDVPLDVIVAAAED